MFDTCSQYAQILLGNWSTALSTAVSVAYRSHSVQRVSQNWSDLVTIVKTCKKISGYMYEFQDLTPISGRFRKNFKISVISGQRPGLSALEVSHLMHNINSQLNYLLT